MYTKRKLMTLYRAAGKAYDHIAALTKDDPNLEDADLVGLGEYVSRAQSALDDLATKCGDLADTVAEKGA